MQGTFHLHPEKLTPVNVATGDSAGNTSISDSTSVTVVPLIKPRSGSGEDLELLYLTLFEAFESPADSSFHLWWAVQYRRCVERPLDSANGREQAKH